MTHTSLCPVCENTSFQAISNVRDHSVTQQVFALQTCQACGLTITDPQPSQQELPKFYCSQDYVSHTSEANNLINSLYLFIRKFTLSWKESLVDTYVNKSNILDVGCGTGHFLALCKKRGWQVEGVEPSDSARQIATRESIHVSESLKDTKTSYNAITLWHVLEHLTDINLSINELREKLSPTGHLFIAVPNPESYDARHYQQHWAAWDVPRHLWHFNKKSMQQLLTKHGLNIVAIKPMLLDAFYVSMLSEKYLHGNRLKPWPLVRALSTAVRSNLKAKRTLNHSSLIYIAKK